MLVDIFLTTSPVWYDRGFYLLGIVSLIMYFDNHIYVCMCTFVSLVKLTRDTHWYLSYCLSLTEFIIT